VFSIFVESVVKTMDMVE